VEPHLAASSSSSAGTIVGLLIGLVLVVFVVAAMWKMFAKAGQPGWAAIIPFYNIYVLLKIAGRPGWWLILYIVPLVNIVISIIVSIDVAKAFGKGAAFGVLLLWLFGIIGYPILGFGSARYVGRAEAQQPVGAY
jgi:hypothetical protein